jgi:maleylacetate reductase
MSGRQSFVHRSLPTQVAFGAGLLGAPLSLAELGMAEDDVPRIAELAVAGWAAGTFANPRPVTREGVEALLRAAWAGESPPALYR